MNNTAIGIGISAGVFGPMIPGVPTPPVTNFIITEAGMAPPLDVVETEGGDPMIVE